LILRTTTGGRVWLVKRKGNLQLQGNSQPFEIGFGAKSYANCLQKKRASDASETLVILAPLSWLVSKFIALVLNGRILEKPAPGSKKKP
jgi:hypothetical protein